MYMPIEAAFNSKFRMKANIFTTCLKEKIIASTGSKWQSCVTPGAQSELFDPDDEDADLEVVDVRQLN